MNTYSVTIRISEHIVFFGKVRASRIDLAMQRAMKAMMDASALEGGKFSEHQTISVEASR